MSDISLEYLNGLWSLVVICALGAGALFTGIVFVLSRSGAPLRWRSRYAISSVYGAACVGLGFALQTLPVQLRAAADSYWVWWALAVFVGWLLCLRVRPARD